MYEYFNGKLIKSYSNYIIIDINGIGYKIFTPNPYKFIQDECYKVYIYNHIREDENSLYGFYTEEERDMFLKLINVKGLGPKVALTILASSSLNGIVDAIERENILYLKKIPKVGEKLARQIILDLKGKLVSGNKEDDIDEELIQALMSLGYKQNDIKGILPKIDNSLIIENKIKEALKLLLR